MISNLLEELIKVPEFKSVPTEQLQWLVDHGSIRTFQDGERGFAKDDTIDGFSIVLRGGLTIYFIQGGSRRNLGTYEPGEILGRLPYSRMKKASGEGIAEGELIMYFLHRDLFPELIKSCHDITEALVHNMTDRVRDFTRQQQQNDKMMALGKLSAGLAHELNNPSAAIIRSAQELKKHLSNVPESFKSVIKIKATDQEVDQINDFHFSKIKNRADDELSMMEKSAREDELGDWLEKNNIPNAYEMTEIFTEYDFEVADLESLKKIIRTEDQPAVINWLSQMLVTEKLVTDIEDASRRINTLVCSVKGYTHMDQAPEKQLTEIKPGIVNTLIMLGHKLKKNNIQLIKSFPEDLPKAHIYVSELNQVWTNIIDNAIDAMEGRPDSKLEIKAVKDRDFILVSIIDNGPGIPKDIQDKIFDPFFTTKPVGKGTGLGLEVVQQIIHQHNGKVDLFSEPGRTEFRICIPI